MSDLDHEERDHLVEYQKLVNDVTSAYKRIFDIIMEQTKKEFEKSLQIDSLNFQNDVGLDKKHTHKTNFTYLIFC